MFIFSESQASSIGQDKGNATPLAGWCYVLKYQVCCQVFKECSMVAFAIIPCVPDLAHSFVGWTVKDAGRLGLYPPLPPRRARQWLSLWQPRDGTPLMEWIFLTYHIGNWTNIRSEYCWSLKKNQIILKCSPHRLKIFSEESVPLFGPPLPSPPVFTDHQEFRDFLLVKRKFLFWNFFATCSISEHMSSDPPRMLSKKNLTV